MSAPMALCPGCGAPLICTMAWSKYEFYCLDCGRHVDWLGPTRGDGDDPDLQTRYAAIRAEWDELTDSGKALLGGGVMLLDTCATCKQNYEPHREHATEEEIVRSDSAYDALATRAGVAATA